MPCRRDDPMGGFRDLIPERSSTRVKRLHRQLLNYRDEPIPPELCGYVPNYDAEGALCDKLRECGGTPYLEKLQTEQPRNRIYIREIIAWWEYHLAKDAKEAQDAVQL